LDSDYHSCLQLGNIIYNGFDLASWLLFSTIVLLLGISAFISASEVAFFSLSPGNLSTMEEGNHRSDAAALKLHKNSEYLLATILIANNLINVSIIILCTVLFNSVFCFARAFVFGLIAEVLLLTFLLLLFGEIMPKMAARTQPLKMARLTAPVLNVLKKAFYPISYLLVRSSNFTNRMFVRRKKDISVDELSKALELTTNEIPDEKGMLEGIIKFYDRTAVEIMTSRIDVADIDFKSNFKEVLAYILEVGYSRIPVYDGSHDQIKGVLYIKCWPTYLR